MPHPIAAGIGGSGGWRALAWAADLAVQTGERLVLLHVCVPGSPLDRLSGEPAPAEVEVADAALARAYATVQARLGRSRAVLKIDAGVPADRLVEVSAGVRLLVIGDGEGGRTVRRVVRRAYCPAVVVRPAVRASAAPFAGHVVAGVDDSAAGRAALEVAYDYAAQHRFPLAAVHVSNDPPDGARRMLAAAVAPWSRRYPDVPARCSVLGGSAADELIRAGTGARLLVVGDKRRDVIGRVRTGDVPVTVATGAPCPVAVVPVSRHDTEPL
jgi:nucleotide-binding universal stress UspA family protein